MKIHGLQKKIKLRKTKRRIIYNGESLATTHGSANSKKSQTATTENSSVMHQQRKTHLQGRDVDWSRKCSSAYTILLAKLHSSPK